jgi:dienelactone hydrolase
MTRLSLLVLMLGLTDLHGQVPSKVFPGTAPLTLTGDIASQLVEGVDRFLLREIAAAGRARETFYKRDLSAPAAYTLSLEPNRKRLAHILGVRDARVAFRSPELVSTVEQSSLIGRGKHFDIHSVRWPVIGDLHAEGLLLLPTKGKPVADVVAVPDADVTPEQLVGLAPGLKPVSQYARRLAQSHCRVLIPTLIDRTYAARGGRAKMTSREFLYRSAFELGRHLIGYEVQQVLAGVDWFAREGGEKAKIGVIGWGEGGMLALYAAALDPRIRSVCVSGYFGNRDRIWEQPLDRNVFGLLEQFGDAELAAMIAPARVVIEASRGPELTLPSEGGAPARLVSPPLEEVKAEFQRIGKLLGLVPWASRSLVHNEDGLPGSDRALREFLLGLETPLVEDRGPVEALRKDFEVAARQQRLFRAIDRHNQQLLEDSPAVRQQFLPIADQFHKPGSHPRLDLTSQASFVQSIESYREQFATEIIGRFDHKLLPANPRTRLFQESPKWTIYQVVLDVFPDVIAYGLLILPRDLKPGERRPVVVCQHGLEGRPEDTIGKQGFAAYKAFATQLAERGFITFAPQNLYIFKDRFRTLQRKANPIKKTLFSVIVPQHQQITAWLKTLPMVDGERIAFYGLSYGGKTAMRVPPLVKNYCLSICSADFNDWVWKNASSRSPYSYVWTMEYEIFEFDLGNTFNYAEMAALIAPRPFMVERGHFDGVGPDDRVALEFAKVRHLYQARLGLGDRVAIEWFVGPHTINGKGTFDFLHKHLNWPAPGSKK